jgi:hypothetical protein
VGDAENAWRSRQANPFWVLGLPADASYAEVERQGAKLLAMLAAAVPGSDSYQTPLGAQARTPDLVRQSLAELRDPDRRAVHEWWARGCVS